MSRWFLVGVCSIVLVALCTVSRSVWTDLAASEPDQRVAAGSDPQDQVTRTKNKQDKKGKKAKEVDKGKKAKKAKKSKKKAKESEPPQVDASNTIRRGIEWLVEAQQQDGGWGAGSHQRQDIRDPAAVATDPATTAFAGIALIKAGHTPVKGAYRDSVIRAARYLVKVVEKADPKSSKITTVSGTQPQTKLGALIDTAMAAQFLTRVSGAMPEDHKLAARIERALDKCLRRLEQTQNQDGSWQGGGGWAPVLQSALNCSSLELAQAAGRKVDVDKLMLAQQYQKSNVNAETGGASSSAAAGVELYAFAGGLRGNAADAFQAQEVINRAKREGRLEAAAPVSEENLKIAGQSTDEAERLNMANKQNLAQLRRLDDQRLLAGFGNNGGEEFLSYLMTSESLVIAGGDAWDKWNNKMKDRLGKIQNNDGSWSGHHCITSPVFCTAAVLQVLTTERDVKTLKKVAKAAEQE